MKQKYFYISLATLLILFHTSFSQKRWEKSYGGQYNDWANSVQQTYDGGYIVAGFTNSFDGIYLIKTDMNGDTFWTRTYGYTEGTSVQQTPDSGYIVAGYKPGASDYDDIYLIKTNAFGDTLWTRTYGGPDVDNASCIQITADSGYVIIGTTQSFGLGKSDVYLLKTNSSGDSLWSKTYGGPNNDRGRYVQQTFDGGYILVGDRYNIYYNFQIYLVKTDSQGNKIWSKDYSTSYDNINDYGNCVQQTSDSGYVIVGEAHVSDNWWQVYLIKTDSLGDTLWTKTYGGPGFEAGYSVQQTTDGGYIISGQTYSFGAGGYDAYLIKTNPFGDTVWTKTYGGSGDEKGASVRQTRDGGYIIAGVTTSYGAGYDDVYLIKTDANGSTDVDENDISGFPKKFLLSQNFPNPFNPSTTIQFDIPRASFLTLKVYNVLGQEVATLVNEKREAGRYEVVFQSSVGSGQSSVGSRQLASGVYFYRLVAGDYISTKKFLLIK